jgi:hypothetical protein
MIREKKRSASKKSAHQIRSRGQALCRAIVAVTSVIFVMTASDMAKAQTDAQLACDDSFNERTEKLWAIENGFSDALTKASASGASDSDRLAACGTALMTRTEATTVRDALKNDRVCKNTATLVKEAEGIIDSSVKMASLYCSRK